MKLFSLLRKVFYIFLFLFFIFLSFLELSYAYSVLFQDDFLYEGPALSDNWTIEKGNWFITEDNYLKNINPNINTNSYLFYKNGNGWQDYSIRLKIKSENGVDQSIGFRVKDVENYYYVTFRYFQGESGGDIRLSSKVNNIITLLTPPYEFSNENEFALNNWYSVKIQVKDFNFKVYLEDQLIFDYSDPGEVFDTGGIMFSTWTGVIKNLSMLFDELSVTSINPTPSPTPSPTPPPPLSPTLLLPGLGGCWDGEAILKGKAGDSWHLGPGVFIYDNLRDTLTNLTDNDYVEGQNFDVFCYDWRKEVDSPNLPDSEITDKYLISDFKQKIDAFYAQNGNQKINLIGHSMGGLIIRAYAQRYGMGKINKIVTVGTPHYGTVKAYEVWEGADIIDGKRFTLADFFMKLLLIANRPKYSNSIETIRKIAPSGENFLPTFVFMKSMRNPDSILHPQDFIQKNNFLFALNDQNFDEVKEVMTTIAGIEKDEKHDTLRWIIKKDFNWYGTKNYSDVTSGKWEDGKPFKREFSPDGDLHILKLSSHIEGANPVEVTGTHDSIMHEKEGLQAILQGLGLNYIPVENPPPFLFRIPFIATIIHSPADIKITGPDNLEVGYGSAGCANCYYNAEEGVIFISEAPKGNYEIELTPKDGGGDYRLDFGQITKNKESWNSIDGKISDDPIVYPIKFDPQNIQTIPFASENGEELLEIAKNEILSLNAEFEGIDNYFVKKRIKYYNNKSLRYLNNAIKYLSKNNYRKSSTYIIRCLSQIYKTRLLINKYYRQDKIDYTTRCLIANKLMNTIEILNHTYVIVRQNSSAISYKTAQRYLNSSKRLFQRLESNFSSSDQTNYLLGSIVEPAEEFLNIAEEKFNKGNYESSYIHSFGTRWLTLEAMKINFWNGGF